MFRYLRRSLQKFSQIRAKTKVTVSTNLLDEDARIDATHRRLMSSHYQSELVSHEHDPHGEQLMMEGLRSVANIDGASEQKASTFDFMQQLHLYGLDAKSWRNLCRGLSIRVSTDDSNETACHKMSRSMQGVVTERERNIYYIAISYSHEENDFGDNLCEKITDEVHSTMQFALGPGVEYRVWSDRLLRKNSQAEEQKASSLSTQPQRIKWARIGLLPYLSFPTISVTFDTEKAMQRYWIATELLCAITTGGLLLRHDDYNGSLVTKGFSNVQFRQVGPHSADGIHAHIVSIPGNIALGAGELALRLLAGANSDKKITYEADRQEVLCWAREVVGVCNCRRMVAISDVLTSESGMSALKHFEPAIALTYIATREFNTSSSRYINEPRKVVCPIEGEGSWDGLAEWLSMNEIDRSIVDLELEDHWNRGVTWMLVEGACSRKFALAERRRRRGDSLGAILAVKLSSESKLDGSGRVEASLALHGHEAAPILKTFAAFYTSVFGACKNQCLCHDCEHTRQDEKGLAREIITGYHRGVELSKKVSDDKFFSMTEVLSSVGECQSWVPSQWKQVGFVTNCHIHWR